jgi:hypothetical protein
MTIDWPHLVATMLLILAVMFSLQRIRLYQEATRGKRFALTAGSIFIALTALNLIWPQG